MSKGWNEMLTGTPLPRTMTYRSTEGSDHCGNSQPTTRRESASDDLRLTTGKATARESGNRPLCSGDTPCSESETLCGLYQQRSEACWQYLSRMDVSIRRHEGLLAYLHSTQAHLTSNKSIALADLQNRYSAAKSHLSLLYTTYVSGVELIVKEKEQVLSEKKQELESLLRVLSGARKDLELRVRAESKAGLVEKFREHVEEAKNALKHTVSDIDITSEFLTITVPSFRVHTIDASEAPSSLSIPSENFPENHRFSLQQPSPFTDIPTIDSKQQEMVRKSLPNMREFAPDLQPSQKTPQKYAESTHIRSRTALKHPSRPASHTESSGILKNIESRYKELEKIYQWVRCGDPSKEIDGEFMTEMSRKTDKMAWRLS